MLINIYRNWPSDHVGDAPSIKKFMKMEETLMNENDNVITSLGLWSWMKAN